MASLNRYKGRRVEVISHAPAGTGGKHWIAVVFTGIGEETPSVAHMLFAMNIYAATGWRVGTFLRLRTLARRWLSFIRRIWSFRSMNLVPTSTNWMAGRLTASLAPVTFVPPSVARRRTTSSDFGESSDRPCRSASSRAFFKAVGRTGS